jgi:glycosyltransferase involved in cell wall biosynthesis
LNILLLTNHLNTGGITEYLYQLCRQLHGKDGVAMWVASRGGEREIDFSNLGVTCLNIPLTTKSEASPKVLWSFFQLWPLIGRAKIDVMHANTRVTQVLADLLSWVSRIPVVTTCHGYFKPRLSRRLWPCWGRKVIAISDPVRQHLLADLGVAPERVALVYNGVDSDQFRLRSGDEIAEAKVRFGCDPKKKLVGHIGRLSSVKGQRYFIQAAAELCRKRNDLQFLLVGDGPERAGLEALVKAQALDSVFLMKPTVSDTSEAYAAMDVFVMPSLQEGFGLSVLEAQARGVPVVVSGAGGLSTLVRDRETGLIANPMDSASLAGAIETCLDDIVLRRTVVESARRQAVEKFSVRRMALETRVVYSEILC